jgi:tetratricopeptide (TPR) repeat protein
MDSDRNSMARNHTSFSIRQANENLNKGLAHHREGRLAEASACYSAILKAQPFNADALHLSGVIARERGELASSERLIRKAIQSNSSIALFHYNLGLTCEFLGKQGEALECYRRVLALEPSHLAAAERFARTLGQVADLTEAIALYETLLSHTPDVAEAHYELGLLHHRGGNVSKALASYRRAITLKPDCFEFHFNLGVALYESGELAGAAGSYRYALLLKPEDADAHYSLGVVLQRSGDVILAAEAYQKAIEIRPEFPNALSNFGFLCAHMGDLAKAEGLLRRCIAIDPRNVNAHCNLANVFAKQGNTEAALQCCRIAVGLDPNHALTLCNYGALCIDTGDLRAAEVVLRRSVELDSSNIDAHCNLANALAKLGNASAAIEATRTALGVDPKHALTLCNFGVLLDALGDAGGAVQCYQLALASDPKMPLAQFNLGIQRLSAGDFAAGWVGYEARWGTPEFRNKRPILSQPQWRGEEIRGSRILIYSEQGLGDTLQFVRYVSRVAALGAAVVLRVHPSLVRLMRTYSSEITVASIESDEGADFEWQCALMSLPAAFGTDLTNIPAEVPYLRADPFKAAEWGQRLALRDPRGAQRGLRVGLVWSGNPKHANDRKRSVGLEQLSGLTGIEGVRFYSLQKGPVSEELAAAREGQGIVDLGEHLQDFTDTAAIMANLDLIISVDTSVVHLAGAMGKPVWVLVPRVSDWRWLRDRTDSPWYPTMRLFRQNKIGEWGDVVGLVEQALRDLADGQATPGVAGATRRSPENQEAMPSSGPIAQTQHNPATSQMSA